MNGTNEITAIRAIYDDITDTLFCVFKEGYDITLLDHIDELSHDVYLQYAYNDKSLISAEFWNFSKNFKGLPLRIQAPTVTIYIPKEVLLNDPTRETNDTIPLEKNNVEETIDCKDSGHQILDKATYGQNRRPKHSRASARHKRA